jgi:hypothetical protein
LKEFLPTGLKLMVKSVNVAHSDKRDNDPEKTQRSKPDPKVKSNVKPSYKNSD